MSGQADEEFATAVVDTRGTWAGPPAAWSFSSLEDAEQCPRRWMLRRAEYPLLWNRSGYPPSASVPALMGDVVHRVLEVVLRAIAAAGCSSLAAPGSVEVLRSLGGFTKIAEDAIAERMRRLEGNPRLVARLDDLDASLRARLPEVRERVQRLLARQTVVSHEAGAVRTSTSAHAGHEPAEGVYPEVELRAPSLRFVGRVDLLTISPDGCTITDYKTGAPSKDHAGQVRTYALLWMSDDVANPSRLPLTKLVLAYEACDEVLPAPTPAELETLAEELAQRIVNVEAQLRLRPPPAYPSVDACRFCSVRQLCDEYWATALPGLEVLPSEPALSSVFGDRAALVSERNGPRSWSVILDEGRTPALLRTAAEAQGFSAGDRVRLLGVAIGRDEDTGRAMLTMTKTSEVFRLRRER